MGSDLEYEKLLTPMECAALWNVNPKTITRWAKGGWLTPVRTPGGHRRYKESEVRALLTSTPEKPPDPLAAPVHSLWPARVTGSAATVLSRLHGAGIVTVGNLTALGAVDLEDIGLRPPQVDEVRLVLYRKGLALRGEVLDKVA